MIALYYNEWKKCQRCSSNFSARSLAGNPYKYCAVCRNTMFAAVQAYCAKNDIKSIAQKFIINKKEEQINEII